MKCFALPSSRSALAVALVGIGAISSSTVSSLAQSSDAIIDKLVEKGVLSVDEATDLRQQADADFTKATQVKNGMPDWVTSLKINGDFRGRAENFHSDNPAYTARTRFRYRVRLGFDVTMLDDIQVGIRLASGDPAVAGSPGLGGNPVSANTTFNSNASRKNVYLDAAFAKWTPIHDGAWTASATVGKFDNPFQVSNMVFDYDWVPEGASAQVGYQFNDQQSIKAIGAAFVLGELNQGNIQDATANTGGTGVNSPGHTPAIFGGQMIWEAKWTKKLESQTGLAFFDLNNKENLGSYQTIGGVPVIPNVNSGNSRSLAPSGPNKGQLLYDYNPIVVSEAITYKLDSFPMYKGAFPVKLSGEYINNPAAPSKNDGYRAGITFGKAGEKGRWELSYRYQYLSADAWWEEVEDDDNGAYFANYVPGDNINTPLGGAYGAYRGGTNVKGHLMQFQYSLTDSATLVLTYYLNTLIDKTELLANPGSNVANPYGKTSAAGHFLADINFKF
jgi:hypothetical protein